VLYEYKQVDSESRDSDGMSHEVGVVSGAQTSDCLSHECFLVSIMSATFVDAGIRVVGTSGGGSRIPLSSMTLLPNKRLAGEAPVLAGTDALIMRCTNGKCVR
jgi:hypothetical protein